MVILSLFDGMACGRVALERAGVEVDGYFASEVDKHAIQVAKNNWSDIVHIGDVTKIKYVDGKLYNDQGEVVYEGKVDILIGGSPCQGFSFAGKQLNFDDPRSKLFFEFVRLLKETKPRYFLLENVKMKKEYEQIITEHLGVESIEINSNLLSAQNRKRIYWTNIPGVTIPNDKGILLKDIVHENNDEVSNVELPNFNVNPSGKGMNGDVYSIEKSKSRTLTTNKGEGQKISVAIAEFIVPFDKTLQILDKEVQRGKIGYFRKDSQANRVYYIHDKAITLTGEAGGGAAKMGQYLFGCITPDRVEKRQNGQRFNDGKKFYTLTAQDKHGVLIEGYIRKLTPIECERLQTVPDNEIICIFTSCLDQVKNYVNAVEKNPKLLKLALSAEKEELNEFVKLVTQNTKQNHQKTRFIVPQNADMTTWKQTNQCTKVSQKENNTTVNNAENIVMFKHQNQEADSVLPNAFINIIEGRIMRFGKEELLLKDKNCTNQIDGKKPLVLFGKEIMELVKDVDAGMKKNRDMISTSTILSVLSINSLEQMLATYYLFAKNAITGYTQNTTSLKSLSIQFQINDGYTAGVSNSQRYKMLGNGWTVSVISHIFSFIKTK